ncbi:zeta-sarcoglycan-like [Gigantopelta aegis]|uniref:zeta-sarcoglycan-like n=1 Tax=Gigantopelta aegis TaxID=1735272 RepID=UPI001B88A737|nr:zeta-sarcoglycan-like [Gigantopelta aegis]XP_041358817.1 zeta-sarcoglycan-like [Gigantopelta aegis]
MMAPEYESVSQPIGIYGWRKRCLYAFILFLMVVVIMNLSLTVWILRVMNFSIHGMGSLRIIPKGIRVEGESEFLRSVYAHEIKSKEGQPLYIESREALRLQAINKSNKVKSSLVLEDDKIEVKCGTFEVKDTDGKMQFKVTNDEVVIGLDEVVYPEGVTFKGSVETPSLRGPISEDLVVESEEHAVRVSGFGGVEIRAPAGDVSFESSDSIRLQATTGSIYMDSSKIYIKNIQQANVGGTSYPNVYQLCLCENGRVFLSEPAGDCQATNDICGS